MAKLLQALLWLECAQTKTLPEGCLIDESVSLADECPDQFPNVMEPTQLTAHADGFSFPGVFTHGVGYGEQNEHDQCCGQH